MQQIGQILTLKSNTNKRQNLWIDRSSITKYFKANKNELCMKTFDAEYSKIRLTRVDSMTETSFASPCHSEKKICVEKVLGRSVIEAESEVTKNAAKEFLHKVPYNLTTFMNYGIVEKCTQTTFNEEVAPMKDVEGSDAVPAGQDLPLIKQ